MMQQVEGAGLTETEVTLGRIVATPAVLRAVTQGDIDRALRQHRRQQLQHAWPSQGQRPHPPDNEQLGVRMISAHTSSKRVKFLVITEADLSATSVLLPGEY